MAFIQQSSNSRLSFPVLKKIYIQSPFQLEYPDGSLKQDSMIQNICEIPNERPDPVSAFTENLLVPGVFSRVIVSLAR